MAVSMMITASLMATQAATAAPSPMVSGLICTASDGARRRLNIDLQRARYDTGEGAKRLSRVTDAVITIEDVNPDLMSTPMGPILHSLKLDRATLELTDQTLIPDRRISRATIYRCVVGAAIDFRADRRF